MEIILLERVGKLGNMGDVVTVKDGFARNYLLPQGKALRSNKTNLARFEAERAELEKRNLEKRSDAEGHAGTLDGQTFIAIRQSSDSGQLYGSVSTRDIAGLLASAGVEISRSQVRLNDPIKTLGLHEVEIALHPEVETKITLNVARSEEEAGMQARGEDVTQLDDDIEEEETLDVEEVFEDAELAAEAEAELAEAGVVEEAEVTGETEAAVEENAAEEAREPADEPEDESEDK